MPSEASISIVTTSPDKFELAFERAIRVHRREMREAAHVLMHNRYVGADALAELLKIAIIQEAIVLEIGDELDSL